MEIVVKPAETGFALMRGAEPMLTPKRRPLSVSTQALAEAIQAEWKNTKYMPKSHPLTAIAYTAIDVVGPERQAMEAAMLAYAETDLLCYRAENKDLAALQEAQWGPVLSWITRRYECVVEVTAGIMPVEQSPLTLKRFQQAVAALSDMELAAFSVLTQCMGSILLALAVYGEEVEAKRAFTLSRLDEEFQNARWGVDAEAEARANALKKDVLAANQFLRLSKQV